MAGVSDQYDEQNASVVLRLILISNLLLFFQLTLLRIIIIPLQS